MKTHAANVVGKFCLNANVVLDNTYTFANFDNNYITVSDEEEDETPGLQKVKYLGQGRYGRVELWKNRTSKSEIAVKIVPMDHFKEKEKRVLQHTIGAKVNHERLVKYIDSKIDNDILYIYMEYMSGGSLDKILKDHLLSETRTKIMLKQILEGLAYLHSVPIAHLSLKSENILLTADQNYIKLSDFGTSKILSEVTAGITTATNMVSIFRFMAPEMFDKQKKTTIASDIWSVGCVLIQMLTQNPPWGKITEQELMYMYVKSTHPTYTIPENISPHVNDMLSACFAYEPNDRPGADVLLQHPFLVPTD